MSIAWHDIECGSYAADLSLWEELAEEADGTVLDLGCGTGRVALHLGRRGHRVMGIDSDPTLVSALADRAAGLPVKARVGDARQFAAGERFSLALAPMQLMQLFSDSNERVQCLGRIAEHLQPDGKAALAIVERMPEPVPGPPLLPDAKEIDGWVYSSLPIDADVEGGAIVVRRLRQTLSPDGELSDALDEVRLQQLSAETLEREAAEAGLKPIARRRILPTDTHVGSTVVMAGRQA